MTGTLNAGSMMKIVDQPTGRSEKGRKRGSAFRIPASGVGRAAVQQEIPETLIRIGADGGMCDKLRVRLVAAGEQRERRAGSRAGLGDLLDPVGPAGLPDQQAHDDEPSLGNG